MAGLAFIDEMQRRVNMLRDYGVITVLLGSCKPRDIPDALRRETGDSSWGFQCSRIRDYDHFLVRFRTRRAIDALVARGAIAIGNAAVKVEYWSPTWGGYRRLGSGDPRWIKIAGLPLHAWSVAILQEIFDMHGEVMDIEPSGDLENELNDHVVADVLLDARDWSALPNSVGKRIGLTYFKIFIDKDCCGFPRDASPEDILRMQWDDFSAQFALQAPAAPHSSSSSKAPPLIRPSQEMVAETADSKGKKALEKAAGMDVDDNTTLKDAMALIKSQLKKK